VLHYNPYLRQKARELRKNLTESEQQLWSRLRRKQVLGVQFYRQRPIGKYIVDFYCPKAKLVIEIDGSQHLAPEGARKDQARDEYLRAMGLKVLRFNSRAVLKHIDDVLEVVYGVVEHRVKSPSIPL